MKIILGVGNPGSSYTETRHNIGFMVADRLADDCQAGKWKRRFHSLAVEGIIGGERTLLLKPETYVNESGRALRAAMDWTHAGPHEVLIVLDDMNLPLGKLRARPGGSSGGHNGLKSIIEHAGTQDVPRLRIGIGAAGPGKARGHVLSRFAVEERAAVEEAVKRAADAARVWIESGIEKCQNTFNAEAEADSSGKKRHKDKEADD